MKKFLFWATLLGVSFTSCVNDNDSVLSSEENPQPITFEVGKYKPSSRAEEVFPIDWTFGTFAFYENAATQGHSVYMDNVEIQHYNAATPYWAATAEFGEYMWPHQGHLDFVSYYPYEKYKNGENYTSNTLSSVVPKLNSTLNQLSYTGFTVDEANPVDLLYSNKALAYKANTVHYGFTGVPTLFHHALAMLSFKVRAQRLNNEASSPSAVTRWNVTLNSVKIDGIYNQGSVTLNVGAHPSTAEVQIWRKNDIYQTWDYSGATITRTWAPKYSSIPGQVLTTSTEGILLGESSDGNDVASQYFVLPQVLSENQQTITVNYTVHSTSPLGQEGTNTYEVTKSFSNFTSVLAWEMGKHITYIIEIDPAGDIINFAPSIEDWVGVNGTITF